MVANGVHAGELDVSGDSILHEDILQVVEVVRDEVPGDAPEGDDHPVRRNRGVVAVCSGAGTLRTAINSANANPGADRIEFNIAGSAPFVIQPGSTLPTITDPVTIDGTTQPGWSGAPLIEINGSAHPPSTGLVLSASDCIVDGLSIHSFKVSNGVQILGDRCTVRHCWIGLNSTGSVIGANDVGIRIEAADCTIVDDVISGNTNQGLFLALGAGRAIVQRNLIGTDATGASGRRNDVGIRVETPANQIGGADADRNVISGSKLYGILVRGKQATGTAIERNLIGSDVTGTTSIPNSTGIHIDARAPANRIVGNAITGSHGPGISCTSGGGDLIDSNVITANDAEGLVGGVDAAFDVITNNTITDNGLDGIDWTATDGVIAGNEVARNGVWGLFAEAGADRLTISGNVVSANGDHGMVLEGSFATVVGNDVFANLGNGIFVMQYGGSTSGQQNVLQGNSIHGNKLLAIDLLANGAFRGLDTNDPQDLDTGGNDQQNHPVVRWALNAVDGLHVHLELHSRVSTTYVVDLHANTTSDAEAEVLLGSFTVTTDAAGDTAFTVIVGNWPDGLPITALATDPLGNSSELSAGVTVGPPAIGKTLVIPLPGGPPFQH